MNADQRWWRGLLSRPKEFLGRLPRAKPVGCVGYVSTAACFGKARGHGFFDFVTEHTGQKWDEKASTCHKYRKGPACGNKITGRRHGPIPDKPPLAGAGRFVSRHGQ